MSNLATLLPPGFRFHPTDKELILHYLRNRTTSSPCPVSIIAEVDIYKFDPWDLPAKAIFGDREWYFFSSRDRKYPNGIRPNRAAASGYWKATGTDKPISSGNENIGMKKTLVFYTGRPPKGLKTDWLMHEYRLAEAESSISCKPIRFRNQSMRLDDWVLCRIYKKSNHSSNAMTDHQQEASCAEDYCLPMMSQCQLVQEHQGIGLPKTSPLSEFLEDYTSLTNIYDNESQLPRFDNNSLIGHHLSCQTIINPSSELSGNGYFLPQVSHAKESPVSFGVKHQILSDRGTEESSENLRLLKTQNEPSILANRSNNLRTQSTAFLASHSLASNYG